MQTLAENPVWGKPLIGPDSPGSIAYYPSPAPVSITRQLHTFLSGQLHDFEPGLVIVIERKGTAVFRALNAWNEERLGWPWEKVISSSAVGQMPDEFFVGRKLLVFDDMTRTGTHIVELLEELEKRALWKPGSPNLRLAVFAAHAENSEGVPYDSNTRIQFACFYRYLTSVDYERVRTQIIRMLQHAGSLMLDTEHLEVRVRLHGNFNQFVTALSRRAKVVVFRSHDQLTNITVFYEDDGIHQLPETPFPAGMKCKSIVKKCRVLQVRPGVDEYSIMPICFPSIPAGVEGWPTDLGVRELLGYGGHTDDTARFYGTGLLAAIEVLRWALKDLGVLEDDAYTLNLPKDPYGDRGKGGYTLEHLRAMYPTLDLTRLTQIIAGVAMEARSEGKLLRSYKQDPKKLPLYEDTELRANALKLVQIMRLVLDRRVMEQGLFNEVPYPNPFGLTAQEIFDIGKSPQLGWEEERTSTLFDILIDEGLLVTHVEKLHEGEGALRVSRTFEPDGEVVSKYVRHYTKQWGVPYGF